MQIFINPTTNFTLVKKNNKKSLILYSNYYFIKYLLNDNSNVYFNNSCRVLVLKNFSTTHYNNRQHLTNGYGAIKNLAYEITSYIVKKIRFLGKSYKIKKCLNYFSFEFNKSHIEIIV